VDAAVLIPVDEATEVVATPAVVAVGPHPRSRRLLVTHLSQQEFTLVSPFVFWHTRLQWASSPAPSRAQTADCVVVVVTAAEGDVATALPLVANVDGATVMYVKQPI